jgi:serine/threonine protein kinase
LKEGEPPMPQSPISQSPMSQSPPSRSIVLPLRRWDPERIGPYALIGKLGAGAMGQVFLARSTAGRLVAVKTIRVELAEEPGFRARFAREVAAASRVSGVFTAAVIEADSEADLPWVATAYIAAPTLRDLVKKSGPLPVSAVRWLAAGCAEALASIHSAGLVHRDIKPSNVLVSPEGPRVIDFGVARAAERVQLTSTRGVAGTPAYMAPEQARDPTQVSPASDVFSLGATLVYAATGQPPYQGETMMDILVRLATEPPDLSDLPDELQDLVGACLQRVPRDRPSDAAILSRLGPFQVPAGSGHRYLPDSAMSVIAEYQAVAEHQHHPQLVRDALAPDDEPGGGRDSSSAGSDTRGSGPVATNGDTNRSQTPLPGFEPPAVISAASPLPAPAAGSQDGRRIARGRRRRRPAPRRAELVLLPSWARAVAGVALLTAGVGVGFAVHGSGARPTSIVTPAPAVTVTATVPPSGPPLPTGVPKAPGCSSHEPSTTPVICVNQPFGDGDTVFVIHGSGFVPFTTVTVSVVGVGSSPDQPITDKEGTFNYAVDQGHRFFSGPMPPGHYEVVATTADGGKASITLTVNPDPLVGTSGEPQPGGGPPG